MAEGRGGSLGAALMDALGRKSTYTAKGWHAQIAKLTASPRGSAAADAVGLDISARTLRAWLAESQTPSPANQARIKAAYEVLARAPLSSAVTDKLFAIKGRVKIGSDERDRGAGRHGPLRIEGRNGDWSNIRARWEDPDFDEDELEEMFIEDVIYEDISDLSGGSMEFPGGGYTVSTS